MSHIVRDTGTARRCATLLILGLVVYSFFAASVLGLRPVRHEAKLMGYGLWLWAMGYGPWASSYLNVSIPIYHERAFKLFNIQLVKLPSNKLECCMVWLTPACQSSATLGPRPCACTIFDRWCGWPALVGRRSCFERLAVAPEAQHHRRGTSSKEPNDCGEHPSYCVPVQRRRRNHCRTC